MFSSVIRVLRVQAGHVIQIGSECELLNNDTSTANSSGYL